jgi:hypothetical protein
MICFRAHQDILQITSQHLWPHYCFRHPTMPTDKIKIQHVYSRAGFGIHPLDLHKKSNSDLQEIVTKLFSDAETIKDLDLLDDPRSKTKDFGAFKILKQILKSNRDLAEA